MTHGANSCFILGLTVALLAAACGESSSGPADNPASSSTTTADDAGLSTGQPEPDQIDAVTFTGWPADPASLDAANPAEWTVEIVDTLPHDREAFTQGYELVGDVIFESTGLRGESTLRTVDPTTGEVLQRIDLEPELFGEGLTASGDEIVQITWQENVALRWQLPDLTPLTPFSYDHEGWGICELESGRLAVSDGTPTLRFRSSEDFALVGEVTVTFEDLEVAFVNELECVDGWILANLLQAELLVVIDASTGAVVATIDATELAEREGLVDNSRAVLNGIAQLDNERLALTGKLWPTVYIVTLTD